jgi:hypothetical protein
METQKEVRDAFWRDNQDWNETYTKCVRTNGTNYRRRTQNEYPATIRSAFVDYVDRLCRNGEISDKLAQIVTL